MAPYGNGAFPYLPNEKDPSDGVLQVEPNRDILALSRGRPSHFPREPDAQPADRSPLLPC
jgi:hypothetical protein